MSAARSCTCKCKREGDESLLSEIRRLAAALADRTMANSIVAAIVARTMLSTR